MCARGQFLCTFFEKRNTNTAKTLTHSFLKRLCERAWDDKHFGVRCLEIEKRNLENHLWASFFLIKFIYLGCPIKMSVLKKNFICYLKDWIKERRYLGCPMKIWGWKLKTHIIVAHFVLYPTTNFTPRQIDSFVWNNSLNVSKSRTAVSSFSTPEAQRCIAEDYKNY